MILKRVIQRIAISAAVIGFVASFTAPIASGEPLSNGLDVTCNPVGPNQLTCVIGGCPRVNGDYVVDIVHVMDNGYQFPDEDFKCINGQTVTHNAAILISSVGPAGYTFGFQACRFKTFEENWCTPWANYTWKPPAASPQQGGASPAQQKAPDVVCGPDDETPTVPAGQQCKAKPKPPVDCPPGGPQKQVPAGQTCPAPANAVTVSFQRSFATWTVNVKNNAGIGGSCHYEAVDTGGGFGAQEDFNIEPNGTASFQKPAPVLTRSYTATTTCTGTYDGKQVQFGNDVQTIP
jgi:hypothetical protein